MQTIRIIKIKTWASTNQLSKIKTQFTSINAIRKVLGLRLIDPYQIDKTVAEFESTQNSRSPIKEKLN